MLPPAPPTFSITTDCPSVVRILSAMIRAAESVEPPGGNGTISVIGREGYVCACASAAPTMTSNDSAAHKALMTFPRMLITPAFAGGSSSSVDLGRALQRLFQFLQREVGTAGD